MKRIRAHSGFSLTELLVVIAIILVLMSLLVVGTEAIYTHAMQLNCQHRMEQIGQACLMYAAASRGCLPAAWSFSTGKPWYDTLANKGYIDNRTAMQCPVADITPTSGSGGSSANIPTDRRDAIVSALDWLKANQVADSGSGGGHWSKNGSGNDCDATGLAVNAFLGYGVTTSDAKYGATLLKGLKYLVWKQTLSTGAWGNPAADHRAYHQGTFTMAVCDAYAAVGDLMFTYPDNSQRSLKSAAQKAIDCMYTLQHPVSGGFVYGCSDGLYNDVSVATWYYQGLKSAITARLSVPAEMKTRADSFLRIAVRDYSGSSSPYRFSATADEGGGTLRQGGYNSLSPNRMTAATLLLRLFFGHSVAESDTLAELNWLKAGNKWLNIAQASSPSSSYDLYFVYYTTLALYLIGGSDWSTWDSKFVAPMLSWQNADGSWPTSIVPYGGAPYADKEYPTSLAVIALEVSVANYLPGTKWCIAGEYSYGYNKFVGETNLVPAPGTIILMDYMRSGIDALDPEEYIAPRHGGKVNILFSDGHIDARYPADITEVRDGAKRIKKGMLTIEPGD